MRRIRYVLHPDDHADAATLAARYGVDLESCLVVQASALEHDPRPAGACGPGAVNLFPILDGHDRLAPPGHEGWGRARARGEGRAWRRLSEQRELASRDGCLEGSFVLLLVVGGSIAAAIGCALS